MRFPILAVCLMAAVVFVPACNAQVMIVKNSDNVGQLMKDGVAWEPHGVVSVAMVQTAKVRGTTNAFALAYAAYSEDELNQMKTDGVDTIRFQISQPGLNPNDTSGNYDSTYLPDLEDKVNMALEDGLVVILSLQAENQGGTYSRPALPNAVSISDWKILAADSNFQNNPYVIFEMFNEPSLKITTANWKSWRTAHNNVISAIRTAGADNVVIADGLSYGKTLDGALNLTDPLTSATPPQTAQIAYSTHPYFTSAAAETETGMATAFGNWAATHAVVNTEWGAQDRCDANTKSGALLLLQYMHSKNVGMMAYAMDNANIHPTASTYGKMFQTMDPWVLTTLVGVTCQAADTSWGPGNILSTWYLTGTPATSPE